MKTINIFYIKRFSFNQIFSSSHVKNCLSHEIFHIFLKFSHISGCSKLLSLNFLIQNFFRVLGFVASLLLINKNSTKLNKLTNKGLQQIKLRKISWLLINFFLIFLIKISILTYQKNN